MGNSPVAPFTLRPMPPGWITDHSVYGYYDGPTHGIAKTSDDRLFLFKIIACSEMMENRLFGFWLLPDHLQQRATRVFELQRGESVERAGQMASDLFNEALASVDDRYGAQILAITADFSEFHAVEMTEAKTPDDDT